MAESIMARWVGATDGKVAAGYQVDDLNVWPGSKVVRGARSGPASTWIIEGWTW